MKRWILPAVAIAIAAVIAWPFIFAGPTVDVKGKAFDVEHRISDDLPMPRPAALRNRGKLDKDKAILCSWDRDRYLYFWSDGATAAFDVAFLDAGGKVLQVGRIRPLAGGDYLDDEGIASRDEARHALFLPEGTTDDVRLVPGDTIGLSSRITGAQPEPLPVVKVGDKPVHVEVCEAFRERQRGLMHRPRMSKDEGMLFIYPTPRTGLNFYMRNTLMSLDIAYFDGQGRLVNAVPTARAENPATQGKMVNAPAQGSAQFVLEVPIGWFAANGFTDDKGRPLKTVALEMPENVRAFMGKAEEAR